jgi:acyl-CoA reductase-like NAD-dependent aldehyde dehydrogenase
MWKDTSPFTRRAIFLKALGLLEQRKNDFIQLAIHETTANGFWAYVSALFSRANSGHGGAIRKADHLYSSRPCVAG